MITHLRASRYRCFLGLDLPLGSYHVLAGSNGSGKSTLMDIPSVFADLNEAGTIDDVFFSPTRTQPRQRARKARELVFNQDGSNFGLGIELELPAEIAQKLTPEPTSNLNKNPKLLPTHLWYEVILEAFNDGLQVGQETLVLYSKTLGWKHTKSHIRVIEREGGSDSQITSEPAPAQRKQRQEFSFSIRPEKLALRSIPADEKLFPVTNWFRSFLAKEIAPYGPALLTLQAASAPQHRDGFDLTGASLPWQILDLRDEKRKRDYEDWLIQVRSALPAVKEVSAFQREDDNYAYTRIDYRTGLQVPSTGLSEGTLHILALTVLPYALRVPKFLTVEEPENGTHPQGIETILESIATLPSGQVLVSSHSPIVIAQTPLDRILTMRTSKEGAVTVVPGSEHPRLRKWKGEADDLDLGRLFAAGVFE